MLRDEIELYSELSGNDGQHTAIGIIGAYLDGYERGKASADTQSTRKTAEWVYGEKDGADGWYCSRCGFHIPWYYDCYGLKNIDFIRDFHTCPHCDVKMLKYTGMDGEQDEKTKTQVP